MLRTLASTATLALSVALSLALAAPAARAATMSDAWITTRVKMALLTSEGLSTAHAIDVDTAEAHVTLHGAVGSQEERTKAAQVARDVSGVREVRNLIDVRPAAPGEPSAVSDATVRERVTEALAADAALRDSAIEVRSVQGGVVVLGGEARTLSDARRALEDAAAVDGVIRVASEIRSPEELSDTETFREEAYDQAAYAASTARDAWITSATKLRLIANAETPAFDVNVDTRDQVVTLFGTVDSPQAKQAAEAEARKVEGVRDVVNALQVVAPADAKRVARSDAQLDEAIESRLAADQRIAEDEIDVAVEDGVARLRGSVPSRSAEMAALVVTRRTPGVKRVIDDLELEPPAVGAR